jgi:hypothetical protein
MAASGIDQKQQKKNNIQTILALIPTPNPRDYNTYWYNSLRPHSLELRKEKTLFFNFPSVCKTFA